VFNPLLYLIAFWSSAILFYALVMAHKSILPKSKFNGTQMIRIYVHHDSPYN
jgi:hypothetical protein